MATEPRSLLTSSFEASALAESGSANVVGGRSGMALLSLGAPSGRADDLAHGLDEVRTLDLPLTVDTKA
jgi:hypothetical protein